MPGAFAPPNEAMDHACSVVWQRLLEEHHAELRRAGWWERRRIQRELKLELEERLLREIPAYAAYRDSRLRQAFANPFVLW